MSQLYEIDIEWSDFKTKIIANGFPINHKKTYDGIEPTDFHYEVISIDRGAIVWRSTLIASEDKTDFENNYISQSNKCSYISGNPSITVDTNASFEPTFMGVFPTAGYGTFAANAQQAVIYNNNTAGKIIKIQKVIYLPDTTARTGALSGIWYIWRRVTPTVAPSGGANDVFSSDTIDTTPAGITFHSKPTTVASGGTLQTFSVFTPQPDEIKLTTLDAPTMGSLFDGMGVTIYDAKWGTGKAKPITIRQNQTFEVVQTSTPGTGYFRLLLVFTIV
jgi:hypothetical protein